MPTSLGDTMQPIEDSFPQEYSYDPLHPKASIRAKAALGLFMVLSLALIAGAWAYTATTSPLPTGFVYLSAVDKEIQQDIRYETVPPILTYEILF